MKRIGNREMRGGVPKRRPGILNKPGRISLGRRAIININPKKGTTHESL
jgi:hypothetical protein